MFSPISTIYGPLSAENKSDRRDSVSKDLLVDLAHAVSSDDPKVGPILDQIRAQEPLPTGTLLVREHGAIRRVPTAEGPRYPAPYLPPEAMAARQNDAIEGWLLRAIKRAVVAREAFTPTRLDPATGERTLERPLPTFAVSDAIAPDRVLAHLGNAFAEQAPVVLLTGAQGTGKSRALLRTLAAMRCTGIVVWVLVPTHRRADMTVAEYEVECARSGAGTPMPAMAIRGRGAPSRRTRGQAMCRRADAVEKAQRSGVAVEQAICATCPLREGCEYIEQRATAYGRSETGGIFVMPHSFVFLTPAAPEPDVIVIDEAVGDAAKARPVPLATLSAPLPAEAGLTLDIEAQTQLLAALRLLSDTLAAPDPNSDLRHRLFQAIPARAFEVYHAAVRTLLAPPEIPEGASDAQIDELVEAASTTRRWAKDVLRVLDAVLAEVDLLPRGMGGNGATDTPWAWSAVSVGSRRPAKPNESTQNLPIERVQGRASFVGLYVRRDKADVMVCSLRKPNASRHNDAMSVMMLDGTGNPDLVRRIFCPDRPDHIQHLDFPFDRVGRVVQTRGKGFSRTSLIGKRSAAPDAPDISPQLATEARRDRKALLAIGAADPTGTFLTGSKALTRMLRDEGLACASNHYGANRGLNDYENCAIGVAVGYEMPRIDVLEDMRRAYSARDPDPFVPLPPGNGGLPEVRTLRRMRDGSVSPILVPGHPDPLCQAILEQVREAEVMQGIDRVRAVWQDRTIYLLNNLALPLAIDVEVDAQHLLSGYDDRRATVGKAQAGVRRTVAQEGLGRLWEPLQRLGGVLPLTPALMASLCPEAWPSEAGAKKWIARYIAPLRQAGEVVEVPDLAPVVPGQPIQGPTLLRFFAYRQGAGKERTGIALASVREPEARVRALFGLLSVDSTPTVR